MGERGRARLLRFAFRFRGGFTTLASATTRTCWRKDMRRASENPRACVECVRTSSGFASAFPGALLPGAWKW